jgi:hypothetical protein
LLLLLRLLLLQLELQRIVLLLLLIQLLRLPLPSPAERRWRSQRGAAATGSNIRGWLRPSGSSILILAGGILGMVAGEVICAAEPSSGGVLPPPS